MNIDLAQFLKMISFVAEGSIVTLQYSIISVCLGLLFGTVLAVFKTSKISSLKLFANFYTSVFRGTPLLIQLSIIYFVIPQITGIKLAVFTAGIMAFSLNSAAYISEIIRAGINAVDIGQFEAARALGLSNYHTMRDIILPQAVRKITPSLINEIVNMLKESAIISMLGEMDILRRAQVIAAENFTYTVPLITAAISYYVLVLFFSWIAGYVERKYAL